VIKLNSQNDIEHGTGHEKNIGYEKYNEQCDLSASAKRIFHELINFKPKKIAKLIYLK
jgi:hypothetical protein